LAYSSVYELLASFRRWLELAYSPRTVPSYMSVVREYLRYYGGVPLQLDPVEEAEVAIEFIESYSPSVRGRRRAAYAIKALYNFLGRPDIAARIPAPRGLGFSPTILPPVVVELIEHVPDRRDRAILCTALDLALRRSEVTLLRRDMFNPDSCKIVVYRLKRPKGEPEQQLMQLSPRCCKAVKEWIEETRDVDTKWLFPSPTDPSKPISRETVRAAFKKLARALGLPHLKFHQIRHTAITLKALETRGDVLALAKYAGHRNPASTLIYVHLAEVKEEELKKLVEKVWGGGQQS